MRSRGRFCHCASGWKSGRSVRDAVPRKAHAAWVPPAERRDPVEILIESSEDRLPELLPIRYGRMMQSPFAFYRGSAALMASDLASTPTTGLRVQACGDAHLVNFGLFATPERNVIFDCNDFDETLPGPWEWDLKRLVASIVVAARDNRMGDAGGLAAAVATARAYRTHMWEYARTTPLDIWYDRLDARRLEDLAPDEKARARRQKLEEQARHRVADHLLPKITEAVDGVVRIVDQPPLIYHPEELSGQEEMVREFLLVYRESLAEDRRQLLDRYRNVDVAVKVVGVGSVGTRAFVALFMSADLQPLLLQIKEARASVLEAYSGAKVPEHNGERVVVGQRLMQAASDIFLGWSRGPGGRDFYVRQLRDMKLSVPMLEMNASRLAAYGEVCGWALARAHANTGDAASISGYLGKGNQFDDAMGEFALAYADQNDRDYALMLAAINDGRIEATPEYRLRRDRALPDDRAGLS